MIKKFICLSLLVILLAGCGNGADIAEKPEVPAETAPPEVIEEITPRSGGTLRVSMRSPITLNPLLNTDATVDRVLKLLFEPLYTLDEQMKPAPRLAEGYELSQDGLGMTVTLKENLLWDNGAAVTAEDVAYSIGVLRQAEETVIYKQNVGNITSCQVLDDRTVKINFNSVFGGADYLLCFPIISKDYYEAETPDIEPMGSGLYRFESYTAADKAVFAKTKNAFGEEAYIDRIEAIITPDTETDMNAFDQSIIDVISSQISDWGKYNASDNVSIVEYDSGYYDFIGFNYERVLFQDVNVRKAIAAMISTDEIINDIYVGHALKATSPVHTKSWLYDTEIAEANLPPEEIPAILSPYTGEDNSLEILVNSENSERIKIAMILKENMEKAGLSCEVTELPFADFQSRLTARDFDLFVGGFSLSYIPDFTFAFHSSQIEGGANYFGINDPELDRLLESAFLTVGENSYKKAMSELQKYFVDNNPCVSIAFRKVALMTGAKVREVTPTFFNIYENVGEWFIYEE